MDPLGYPSKRMPTNLVNHGSEGEWYGTFPSGLPHPKQNLFPEANKSPTSLDNEYSPIMKALPQCINATILSGIIVLGEVQFPSHVPLKGWGLRF